MKTLSVIVEMSLFIVLVRNGWSYEDSASKYEGAQLIKVERDPLVTRFLKARNLDVWGANSTFYDVFVEKDKVDSVKRILDQNDVVYSVADKDLAQTIRKSTENSRRNNIYRQASSKDSIFPTFERYQTVEEINGYMEYLARKYPKVASIGVMGQTVRKRPLKYIKISSGKRNAKTFLIDGGIHAREWVAPATATFVIKQLVENRKRLPAELLRLDFYILPLFNPDGYAHSYKHDRMWRKNRSKNGECYGADINRNFPVEFGGKGTSNNSCREDYHGIRAFSELESQAFKKFVEKIKSRLIAYVTFHSYGQYILIPFGYDVGYLPKDFDEMKRVAGKAALAISKLSKAKYSVGNTASLLYPAAGGSDDWVKKFTKAKYVYTIELRDNGQYGFILPEEFILPTAIEGFEAIRVIATEAYHNNS